MPTGVYPRTLEMNQNMSVALSGRLITEEHRAKIRASKIGNHASEETKAKMSVAHIAQWQEPEFYAKQCVARRASHNIGVYPRTEEMRQKLSIIASKRVGELNPFYGKCHTEESKAKMRAASTGIIPSEETRARIGATGIGRCPTAETRVKLSITKVREFNPNWRGGCNEPYPLDFNWQLKETIRIRDNRTCRLCGVLEEEYFRALDIHHINYDKQDISPMNLISLCTACNNKVNGERAYYQMLFNAKIKELCRCLYGS